MPDSLLEEIAYLYRKVEERGLIRGRTIPGMLVACMYPACRRGDNPRTLKDISAKSNIKRKNIAMNCRIIMEKLEITTPVFDLMKGVVRVANAAQPSERTTRHAFKMMSELLRKKTLIAGKDPMGLAPSILYIASKETDETKTTVKMKRPSPTTLRLRYRLKQTII